MPITQAANRVDPIKKIIYGVKHDVQNHQRGILNAFRQYGQTTEKLETGGLFFEALLTDGMHGGGGVPSNTGSVANIGTGTATNSKIQFPYTMVIGRSTMTLAEMTDWEASGSKGAYYNKAIEKYKDAVKGLEWLFDSAHMQSAGDGRLGVVAENGSEIAAAASGSVSVGAVQHFPPNTLLQVYRTSAVIADVLLLVTANGQGEGAGTITVTNNGGTAYTPTSADILYINDYNSGSAAQIYFASLDESVGTAAYPPRTFTGGATVDRASFRSSVATAGSTKLTLAMVKKLWSRFIKRGLRADDVMSISNTGGEGYVSFIAMNTDHLDAITMEIASERRYMNSIDKVDPGLGRIVVIDGVPVVASPKLPANSVYAICAKDWISAFDGLKQISATEKGPFQRIPESVNYELVLSAYRGLYCVDRAKQMKITEVVGFTDTEAGLTFS